jgi:hypothetical protein
MQQQQAMQQQKPPQNYPGQGAGSILRTTTQPGPPGTGMQMQMPMQNPQQAAQRGPYPPQPNQQMPQQMMGQPYNMMMPPGFPPYPFPPMGAPYAQAQFRTGQPTMPMNNLQQIQPQMGPGNMGMPPVDRMGGPGPNMPGQYPETAAPKQREKKKLFEYDKSTKQVVKSGAEKEKSQGDEAGGDHGSTEGAVGAAAPAPVAGAVPNGEDMPTPSALSKGDQPAVLEPSKAGLNVGRNIQAAQPAGAQNLPVSAVTIAANATDVEKEKIAPVPAPAPAPAPAAEKPAPVSKVPEVKAPAIEAKEPPPDRGAAAARPAVEEKPASQRSQEEEAARAVAKGGAERTAAPGEPAALSSIGSARANDSASNGKEGTKLSDSAGDEKKAPPPAPEAALKPAEERKKPATLPPAAEPDEGEASLRPAQREAAKPDSNAGSASAAGGKRVYEIEFILKFQKIWTKEPAGLNIKNSPDLCKLTGINVPESPGGGSGSGTPRGHQMSNAPQGGPAARPQQRNNNQSRGGGQMGGGGRNYPNRPSMGPPIELRKGENAYDTSKTKPQNHTERIMKVIRALIG